MTGSSSVHDQTAHSSLLSIKQNQNLILDLSPFKYDSYMLPIIECLKYSPLVTALTNVECVPMSLLSKAYSSASYIKEEERITFDISDKKTFITKERFCSLLGLAHDDSMVNPYSISTAATFEMFYDMGYKQIIPSISKFKKPNLPPQWNGLFTLLFKPFFERVTGSDYASKLFMNLMYGLYDGINLNYGTVLWAQLVQSTHSTTRHSEISYARFWTIVFKEQLKNTKTP